MKDIHLKAALLSLGGYSAYAFGDAVAKHLTMGGFSSFQVSMAYCLVTIIFLLVFSSKLGGASSLLHTENKKLHLYRALLFAPGQALNFYAFSKLPMANVYTILFMMPFLTAILAHYFLREKTDWKVWLCILCGFTGVVIVNRPDLHDMTLPVIACIVSFICAAFRNIITRKMGYEETAFSLSIIPCVSIVLICFLPALATSQSVSWMSAFWFVTGGMLFAAGTILIALSFLQKVNLSHLTAFHYSQIIWGILFGIVLFADIPDFHTWLGCSLIVVSGITLIYAREKI